MEETQTLLGYVAQNLPANISTKTEIHNTYRSDETGKLVEDKGTVKIRGTINNRKNFAFDSFCTKPNLKDSSKSDALVFQTIPGYELREHGEEVRELWRDVREQVINY